jgi:hypothetical protein
MHGKTTINNLKNESVNLIRKIKQFNYEINKTKWTRYWS